MQQVAICYTVFSIICLCIMYLIDKTILHFPDFLIVDPLKSPTGVGWANYFRFESFPDLSAYMGAEFGRCLVVVSKKGCKDRLTHTHRGTFCIVDHKKYK